MEDLERWALRAILPEANVLEVTNSVFNHLLLQEQPTFFLVHKEGNSEFMKVFHKVAEVEAGKSFFA